ncbi:MAG: aminoglycoside phosphotransferase family protein [Spongiibacteraceae bacterium]
MTTPCFPIDVAELTLETLNHTVQQLYPEVVIDTFTVIESKSYGDEMVSTAARALLKLGYSANPVDLPQRVVLKLARDKTKIMSPFYANEVAFYNQLRPHLDIEAPLTLGGLFDEESGQFGLLMEDLSQRQAHFPNVKESVSVALVKSLIDTLAKLHATFWQSPRFDSDLNWVQSHCEGALAFLQNHAATPLIQHEIDTENFKREMVQRLRSTGPELREAMMVMHKHQATLPRTLLHGDTHLGNTYSLAGEQGGFLDWQLMTSGYGVHDISYLVTTSLSIAQRRDNEQALLRYYLDKLHEYGVAQPPSFDEAWLEFRRSLVWGVYYGWLTTPVVNYGWEINVLNHLRLTTAYEDFDTSALIAELL